MFKYNFRDNYSGYDALKACSCSQICCSYQHIVLVIYTLSNVRSRSVCVCVFVCPQLQQRNPEVYSRTPRHPKVLYDFSESSREASGFTSARKCQV